MTDMQRKLLKEFMRKRTIEICKSEETARRYLINLGIYNEDGSLHKNYGGDQ